MMMVMVVMVVILVMMVILVVMFPHLQWEQFWPQLSGPPSRPGLGGAWGSQGGDDSDGGGDGDGDGDGEHRVRLIYTGGDSGGGGWHFKTLVFWFWSFLLGKNNFFEELSVNSLIPC